MRLISINSLKPGEMLSVPIRRADGSLLLPANREISENYISRLVSFGLNAVYIVDELFDDVVIEPVINDTVRSEVLSLLGKVYTAATKNGTIDKTVVRKSAETIYDSVFSAESPINLINMFSVDDNRCFHALNVAIIVASMALKMDWHRDIVNDYIVGGLLHDIKLTDMNAPEDLLHAESVYKYLKAMNTFSIRTYVSAYLHHDQYDAKKSNSKLKGDAINEGARMIAVADTYDNLVNGYCGMKKLRPHEAVEYIGTLAGTILDPEMIKIFNASIAVYPTGSTVLLNNGYRAIVTKQNKNTPSRPTVRLLMPKREDCLEFNMSTYHTLFIEKVEL